jgi:A/G-specific adenine glycosylase
VDATARRRLLRWYAANRRDLPWRRSRDPYAVWVSEVMLQQTRVEAAKPYFEAWMRRFPTVEALARASEDEVLAAWSGLGYYRRARNLHAAAREVARSGFPRTASGWRRLPGVGAYTATAVASIAFGEPVAVVDGNVERVACRIALVRQDPKTGAARKRVQALAQDWLTRDPGDWNQAMMELGATVCTPRPRCASCPVVASCKAKAQGLESKVPAPRRSQATVEQRHLAVVRRGGRILLVRYPPGLLGGLWGLPGGAVAQPLGALVLEQAGLRIVAGRGVAVRHAFTHKVWHMTVHEATAMGTTRGGTLEHTWARPVDLDTMGVPAATRVALQAALNGERSTLGRVAARQA